MLIEVKMLKISPAGLGELGGARSQIGPNQGGRAPLAQILGGGQVQTLVCAEFQYFHHEGKLTQRHQKSKFKNPLISQVQFSEISVSD